MCADYTGSVESKRVLKSMPGHKYDSLYYNSENSKVEIVENVATFGKYKINLSSPTYGGTSSITFPNMNFLGKTYLHVEIPVPATFVNHITLCGGFALALINNIEILIGNANISSQRLDRISMFHSLVASKQTADDLKFDIDAAGNLVATDFAPSTASTGRIINGKYVADVVIDLPWSNYCQAGSDKLYFDTSILTAPVTLNISFNQANAIWGTTYDAPVSPFSASLFYRQLELTDRNDSLRNKLFSSPSGVISYPSLYRQSFQQKFVAVTDPDLNTFDLTSFLNSDLFAISISVHLEQDWLPTVGSQATNPTPANPWNSLPIHDVNLKFGGDPIYIAPGYVNELCNQESNISAVYLPNTLVYNNAGTFVVSATKNFVTFINMTRINPYCYNDGVMGFPNTIKLPKQVLQLSFGMPAVQESFSGTTRNTRVLTGASCLLNCTYYYPQVTEVNSTGSVNIFYN
jgi:hypothetical protein